MNNTVLRQDQIKKLLLHTDERLYIGLGYLLTGEEAMVDGTDVAIDEVFNLQPDSILRLIERGQQFITENQESLYQKICIEWNYCHKRNDPDFSDNVALATWIADLITSLLLHSPIVVTTVAVILVKKGLSNFCDCPDTKAIQA